MKYTGLCHTDIVVQQGAISVGEYPALLGHEGTGVVRRIGSDVQDKSLREGDLVFLSFSSCHRDTCNPCSEGRNGFCRDMTVINFAGARGLSAANSPISFPGGKGLPIRGQFFGQSSLSKLAVVTLAPLACGYLTAGTVLNVLKRKPRSTFVILDMGAVGMTAMFAARSQGVETIIAVDILDAKLELAKSLGASHVLDTRVTTDLAQGLRNICPDGVNYILDTTGVDFVLESAVKTLGHDGILAILLPLLIDLYKHGKFPVDRLAKVYAPGLFDKAMEDLRAGRVIKWEDMYSP
ncbi:hypothetical protein BJX65DRAFT_315037 [Aspergillus insuetus]